MTEESRVERAETWIVASFQQIDTVASTMMALRKSLRRGSAWVNHSISFRAYESMLLADTD